MRWRYQRCLHQSGSDWVGFGHYHDRLCLHGLCGTPVFQPAIDVNSPPTDWTIAITYSGGGLSSPQSIATDQQGNVWVASSGRNTITMLSPNGATGTAYSNNGLSVPKSIAIDGSGNVFVGNSTSTSISAFTSAGVAMAGSPFTGSGNTSAVAVNPR